MKYSKLTASEEKIQVRIFLNYFRRPMGNRNAGRFSRRQWDLSPFFGLGSLFEESRSSARPFVSTQLLFWAVGRMGDYKGDTGFVGNIVENPGSGLQPLRLTLMHLTFFEARP